MLPDWELPANVFKFIKPKGECYELLAPFYKEIDCV